MHQNKLFKENIILFILVLTILYSCKKTDLIKDYIPIKQLQENDFFQLNSIQDSDIKEISTEIKLQNDKSDFLDYFINNNGYLLWDKVEKLKSGKRTVSLIPFSLKNQKDINGFVIAYKDDNNRISLNLYKKNSITKYSKTKNESSIGARQLQSLINYFNLKTFGINHLTIADTSVLPV